MRVGITQKHNTNMHSYLTEKEINQINLEGRKTLDLKYRLRKFIN